MEAVEYLERTMRLDPFHSDIFYVFLGSAGHLVGRYEEAAAFSEGGLRRIPSYRPISIWRSATAAQLGRLEEAEGAARHLLHLRSQIHDQLVLGIQSVRAGRRRSIGRRLTQGGASGVAIRG